MVVKAHFDCHRVTRIAHKDSSSGSLMEPEQESENIHFPLATLERNCDQCPKETQPDQQLRHRTMRVQAVLLFHPQTPLPLRGFLYRAPKHVLRW